MNAILLTNYYFADPKKSRPLFNAQVFIGEPGLDPETNPKDIFYEDKNGVQVPAPNPLTTSAGGVIVDSNGDPVKVVTEGDYSILIKDFAGDVVYTDLFVEVSNVSPPTDYLVYLPFGNKIVDTLNGPLSFARSTTRGNINQSGVLETLAIDEIGITKNGASFYQSYTNYFLWSDDYSSGYWSKEGALSITTDGTLGADGVTLANKITDTTGSGFRAVRLISSDALTGETWTYSVLAKAGTIDNFRITPPGFECDFNLANKTASNISNCLSFGIEELNNGWFLCFASGVVNSDNGQVKVVNLALSGSTISDYIYSHGAQATKTTTLMPYVKTSSVALTADPDIAAITMNNNMPAAGQPFSMLFKWFYVKGKDGPFAAAATHIPTSGFLFREFREDEILLSISDGTGLFELIATIPGEYNNTFTSCGIVFDGANLSVYIGGDFLASMPLASTGYYMTDELFIGRSQYGSILNSEMKDFKILSYAATPEQIKAEAEG